MGASDALLFRDRVYMLCPSPDTPPDALLFLIDIAEDLLAIPATIEPEEHDRVMAMISHVPQLLAISLVHAALRDDATHGLLDMVAGRGFLDLTRIAASDFRVWEGILGSNKDAIADALDCLEDSLNQVRRALNEGGLEGLWEQVSRRRRSMTPETLPRLRKPDLRRMIDRYDEQILKALGNRMQVVRRVGQLKANQKAAVLDPDRERRMLAERNRWGQALSLGPEFIADLFALITAYSRQLQSEVVPGEEG